MKPRLFIKPWCGWCHKAMNWLDAHKVDYEVLDVVADVEAYDEMVELSGQTMSPVLDVDGEILADFGPSDLPGFFKRIATRDEPK